MAETWEHLQQLFDRGGIALWAILGCALWIWFQLAECFLEMAADRKARNAGSVGSDARGRRIRDVEDRVAQILKLLPIPPLLGLLGTVIGMIQAFDALAIFGNASPRNLSFGVSQALLTTMGGLLASVLGVFALTPIRRWLDAMRPQREEPQARALAFSPLLALRARLAERSFGDDRQS